MNAEIRMYVEHLFQGRVLTPENIELKEEIYGNLVARYEDLLASGLSPEEAMRQTKASMTSIDDLVDGGDEKDATGSAGAGSTEKTVPLGAQTPGHERPGAPQDPASLTPATPDSNDDKRRKLPAWAKVLIVVAVLLLVLAPICLALFGTLWVFSFDTADQYESVVDEADETSILVEDETSAYDLITLSLDGLTEDEAKSAVDQMLLLEIEEHGVDDLLPHADISVEDFDSLAGLASGLPLGEYLDNVGTDSGNCIYFDYTNVSEYLDDSLLEQALTYDAFCVLACAPDCDTVCVSLHIDGDDTSDTRELYFTRSSLESLFGMSISSALLDDDEGWDTTKAVICADSFASDACDDAEDYAGYCHDTASTTTGDTSSSDDSTTSHHEEHDE